MKQVYKKPIVPDLEEWRAMSKRMGSALNIPADYQEKRGLVFYPEAANLVLVMIDYQGKALRLTEEAASAWLDLDKSARADGIELLPFSGFRSYKYQLDLIRSLLTKGESLETILVKLTAPGFSEHHSGRALDITDSQTKPVSQEFGNTDAFNWLLSNASNFNFSMSYPENNDYGIIYEPWHWCYNK